MGIVFDSYGGAYYYFYSKKRSMIANKEVYVALRNSILFAGVASAVVIVATIAEDIITDGAGISDDVASVAFAASLAGTILNKSLKKHKLV